MSRRFIMRIELTAGAKQKLSALSELIQAAVLRHYPSEIEADVAKLILKRMAGEK